MHFSTEGIEVGSLLVRRNEDAVDVLLKVSPCTCGGGFSGVCTWEQNLWIRESDPLPDTGMSPDCATG